MDTGKFTEIVQEQLTRSTKLLGAKGEEYSEDNYDRLIAFKTAAELQDITQAEALAGMMAKHTVSIYQMCKDLKAYSQERWNEKITDSINYLLILAAVVREELENEEY